MSRAWRRTTAWLRDLTANRTVATANAARWNLLYYHHNLTVDDPFLQADAAAFRSWSRVMTPSSLSNPAWAKSFLGVAEKEADHSDAKASRLATAKFTDWLHEGPAQGLKRQHLFSRVATGWIPSKTGHQPTTNLSELDDLEGLSPQQLQTALAPAPEADTPLGAQHLANAERADWAVQWATEMQHDPLDWPDETEPLPPISLKMFRSALFSFANGTGLGWDGVHPRALLRLPDELALPMDPPPPQV